MLPIPAVGKNTKLVTAWLEPQSPVFPGHFRERNPELEVLFPEPVVPVVLVLGKLLPTRSLRHSLIPPHPEVRPDDLPEEIHDFLLRNERSEVLAPAEDVAVEGEPILVQAAWAGLRRFGTLYLPDRQIHLVAREELAADREPLVSEFLHMT